MSWVQNSPSKRDHRRTPSNEQCKLNCEPVQGRATSRTKRPDAPKVERGDLLQSLIVVAQEWNRSVMRLGGRRGWQRWEPSHAHQRARPVLRLTGPSLAWARHGDMDVGLVFHSRPVDMRTPSHLLAVRVGVSVGPSFSISKRRGIWMACGYTVSIK
jgi:hypothetical protein